MMFTTIAAPLVLAVTAFAQSFSINTPAQLIQCQPAQISWVGGTSPYILSALPAGQVSAAAIAGIATGLSSSPYTWNVNLNSGLNITLRLSDATGAIAYSSPVVIYAGTSNSCLNSSASTSGLSTVSVSSVTSLSSTGAAASASTTSMSMSMSGSTTSSSAMSTSATSAAATSTTSKAWAVPTAVAAVPAIALAAVGGIAALF